MSVSFQLCFRASGHYHPPSAKTTRDSDRSMLHERSEPEGVARLRQEREQASFDTEALHVVLAGGAEKLAAWNAVRRSRTVLRAAISARHCPGEPWPLGWSRRLA